MIMCSNYWVKVSEDSKAIGVWARRSPSPQPSPQGRGRIVGSAPTNLPRQDCTKDGVRVSLSSGERAGVRGNRFSEFPGAPTSQ